MCGVVGGARPAHRHGGIGEQPLEQRDRPWRRGDHLTRKSSEPQAELQHVPGVLGMAPLGELVGPGGVELRPAQRVRVLGGKGHRDGAARPFEPPTRRRPGRPLIRRVQRQEPGRPLDHDLAHIGERLADERDAAGGEAEFRLTGRDSPDPFGAGAGLSRPAAAEHEPLRPRCALRIRTRRQLVGSGEKNPGAQQALQFRGGERRERFSDIGFAREAAAYAEKAGPGARRGSGTDDRSHENPLAPVPARRAPERPSRPG
jgi:hypothetical protein